MKNQLIADVLSAKSEFDKDNSQKLQAAIKAQLEQLSEKGIEVGPVAINIEHNDHINYIKKNGDCIIYNNPCCDSSEGIVHDDANILKGVWDIEPLINVLRTLIGHNNKKVEYVRQQIPPAQLEHLQRALNLLEQALGDIPQVQKDATSDISHDLFDITTLRGLLKGEVYVVHTHEVAESFSFKHNVDWPDYGDEFKPEKFKR